MNSIELNDGNRIPQIGFGVFEVPPEQTAEIVAHALRTGYRSIDTAALYRNEKQVGEALAPSGIAREELFITTKVWNSDHGRERALRAFERSLRRLGLDYVDLYLIHWPAPAADLYVETWRALCQLREEGRARSIGVSNFMVEHLERVIDDSGQTPALNQVELHPHLQQEELRAFHAEHGIATEAWSPLGRGRVLSEPAIVEIAERHGRTPAQVVLRWQIQLGNIAIPRSVRPPRVEENFAVFDFELTDEEMDAIVSLDRGTRIGPHPASFG